MENVKTKAVKVFNDVKEGAKQIAPIVGVAAGLVGIGYLFGRRATTKAVQNAMHGMHVVVDLLEGDPSEAVSE